MLSRAFRYPSALLGIAVLAGASLSGGMPLQKQSSFAGQVEALSEPGGYFDTDNLISNEQSYLQVFPELDRARAEGGAYVGVGPDQNFSYIGRVRPAIAFIVDIRRDNLLLHLLFKALFQQARTRVDYLALLFGRPVPRDTEHWRGQSIDRLIAYIDATAADPAGVTELRKRTDGVITRLGLPLSSDDLATIDRFHRSFINAGLELRFESAGRRPQGYYPTYRDLLLAVDPGGKQGNFLASEETFQFLKSMQARNLVVPVVGNLAGPRALVAIGRLLKRRGQGLSVFYASNVEFYLARAGTRDRFLDNLTQMPRTAHALVIRSVFGRFSGGSSSITESIDDVLAGAR
jgi:hypothetical protein